MTCLDCGHDNEYGLGVCGGCGQPLLTFAPFINPNHVSQLQDAIRACLDEEPDWNGLVRRYQKFADKAMAFSQQWGQSWSSQLSPDMRQKFGSGLADMEQALLQLEEAQNLLDEVIETQDVALLEEADEALTHFFKLGCTGCAALIEELEKEQQGEAAAGSGSLLDLKGL